MKEIARIRIEATNIRSLVWQGDTLADLATGGHCFSLDGTKTDESYRWSFSFDQAVISPSGVYTVIYADAGTKGLVAEGMRIVREINRSFYHANRYKYPVTFLSRPGGGELLAHCPNDYNRIELEDVVTGERLTHRTGEGIDIFHSRLQPSPGGRYLLSAGWVWHPAGVLNVYDVAEALDNPSILDTEGCRPICSGWGDIVAEVEAAAFIDDERLLVTTDPEAERFDEGDRNDSGLGHGELGCWHLEDQRWLSRAKLGQHSGPIMPLDEHVVTFYEHPRLRLVETGEVVAEWPDIATGRETDSIFGWAGSEKAPPMAFDPPNRRFAVADGSGITVIVLGN